MSFLRTGQALQPPNKPSIAVLPFDNLTGERDQEYFADGIVEEIIIALSRIRWLFVIARNSSFAYKGRAVDVKQVGRELGVHYILEGSVRKAGGRVRIGGQLIDTSTGAHLWGKRFDGSLEDIFDLQDQVTVAYGHFYAGRFNDAVSWAELAVREGHLTAWRALAASCALSGRHEQAQKAIAHVRGLDPALRLSDLKNVIPLRRPQDLALLVDGLRQAGLPE